MNILIKGLNDKRYERNLQLIADLFFEDSTLKVSEEADLNSDALEIDITVQINQDRIIAFAEAKEHSLTAERKTNYIVKETEKESFKQNKNVVSHVFLSILQQLTGMTQKWGVLTGIRPTKLMHKQRMKDAPLSETRRHLKEQYLITDEKIDLMEQIVERQLKMIPDLYELQDGVSIYIGIPFCPTKCAYCTFPAFAIQGKLGKVSSFLAGLHYEIQETGRWLKENGVKITTIYFGGGTPTAISAEEMDALYEEMYRSFPDVKNVREVTVEAGRPDTIFPDKLEVLKKWNIDRISINPQSYTDETLKAIGRHHTVQETIDKFHLSRKHGMNNINMDLIIGLPNEGVAELEHSLNETEKLMPESVTVHTLSFKRASEMTLNREKYKVADRTEVENMMDLAQKWNKDNGYVPYYLYRQKNILGNLENVGYAKPGEESLYNIIIMEEVQTIVGLGCGAASKFIDPATGKITHFANPKDPKSYNEGFIDYTQKKLAHLEAIFNRKAEAGV
ncbi:coproporphyrinogen III oxidase [Jeotgalibacillus proteolyticus]|uniref:Coproporphyrinogen III oxidase n=1 Tax=Jeotgalibacillus proteolyticus TaxID=2082395 RepID=A0A2S5GH91_9BACL|nr:coproporphyrinogen III oxidase [Jeotgalibacillus proteolyticus]PPA72420.1 coproporphyrinogen III oxidase [Jeotgalibacillus proteolyticus]